MRVMKEKISQKQLYTHFLKSFIILALCVVFLLFSTRESSAGCNPCQYCPANDCPAAQQIIMDAHATGRQEITEHTSEEFTKHMDWMVSDYFLENILPAMMRMTEQLSAVAMQQVFSIGTFFDAKQQLETQRLFQELQNQAHKDYQPSEDFCWFGTNIRSVASSEQTGRYNALALSSMQMARHTANVNTGGAESRDQDKLMRWKQFTSTYCDPEDNNKVAGKRESGLTLACGSGGGNTERINIDIDFTRLIDEPRTLNVGFFGDPADAPDQSAVATPDEEDVIALGSNLYGHETLTRDVNKKYLKNKEYQHLYFALRSVAAKRGVAENSYNAIVGMKSAGRSDIEDVNEPKTREFLGAVMTELGVPDDEVYQIIGENPSYYAQLEILAKKIYQNPDFFANLYDKPANVQRKSVALKAIDLMLDRAIYESQLRQEMAMSVLLSSRLRPKFTDADSQLGNAGE